MSRVAGFELADDLGPTRDGQIVDIALRGGFVEWPWVAVPLENGRGYFEVAADYFALGSASGEWVRTPLGGSAAQVIANHLHACLPTAFMVDLIWRHGNVKLTPQPFQNLSGMSRTDRFVEHHELIEKQRQQRAGLVVGCKKDVVVSNRLVQYPEAVCIYGWHQANGEPIQPVSTAHRQWWYADYSHGIRFVRRTMVLDGQSVDVHEVMRDPRRAEVLTGGQAYAQKRRQDDAVLRVVEYRTDFLTASPPKAASVASNPSAKLSLNEPTTTSQSVRSDLGLRALQWCLRELAMGVGEEPPGSNAGRRIAEYFVPARRRTTGQKLGITEGDWCAVAQSAAVAAVAQSGEPWPHGYRAAVWELREDAVESGAWVSAADVRAEKYQIQPGDLVVWSRGQPGSRLGHVSRVEARTGRDIVTIGGNENNTWTRRTRNINEPDFEGVIKYHDYRVVDFDSKRAAPQAALELKEPPPPPPAQTLPANDGRVLTADGWMRIEEDYLPRVVTGENGHAPFEALKAQAIAARTYLLRAMRDDRSLGRSVPISNSQRFQVYSRGAFPEAARAVAETRGMVMRHQGQLIIANYVAGALWKNGKPADDPTNTERWVTYNEGRTGKQVAPTKLSHTGRTDNRGCMSQNGANWMAKSGKSFVEILRFFYGSDIEITGLPVPRNENISPPRNENTFSSRPIPKGDIMVPHRAYSRMPPSGIEALAMSVGDVAALARSRSSPGTPTPREKRYPILHRWTALRDRVHRAFRTQGHVTATFEMLYSEVQAWASMVPPHDKAGEKVLEYWTSLLRQWEQSVAQREGVRSGELIVDVGADEVQAILGQVQTEMEALNERMKRHGEPLKSKWEEYLKAWNLFYLRNWFPLVRQQDAHQMAWRYYEGTKDWNHVLDVAEAGHVNKAEGKLDPGGDFPILPVLALVVCLGTVAAIAARS